MVGVGAIVRVGATVRHSDREAATTCTYSVAAAWPPLFGAENQEGLKDLLGLKTVAQPLQSRARPSIS
jgi:hypothetical protein